LHDLRASTTPLPQKRRTGNGESLPSAGLPYSSRPSSGQHLVNFSKKRFAAVALMIVESLFTPKPAPKQLAQFSSSPVLDPGAEEQS
jgi:hypothetical protein